MLGTLGLLRSIKNKGSVADHSSENNKMFLKELVRAFNGKRNPIMLFSAKDLSKSTLNYDPGLIIHKDAFSELYKGKRVATKQWLILVEKFHDKGTHDLRERIINELVVLSQINHKHVLKLLGCCLETELPILVYECSHVNKTLEDLIINDHPSSLLSWESRLRIATDIADAITYIHTFSSRPIINRDIRLANIFLDHQDVAKLYNFLCCIKIPDGQTHVGDSVRGTIVYIDPMYLTTSQLSEKADIYSFGVVLFEILSGKSWLNFLVGINFGDFESRMRGLIAQDRHLRQLVDPRITENEEQMSDQQLEAYANLIVRCTYKNEDERPEMIEVAKELRRIWKTTRSSHND